MRLLILQVVEPVKWEGVLSLVLCPALIVLIGPLEIVGTKMRCPFRANGGRDPSWIVGGRARPRLLPALPIRIVFVTDVFA